VSSFALERADMADGTGLLTRGLLRPVAPSHSITEQWHRATGKLPLTVAGQWRLSTALPDIPRA
jgi:hypothetical protein